MKKLLVCFFVIVVSQIAIAQDANTVVVNPLKQNEQEVRSKIYQYPEFVVGQAIYKNETVTQARLNYNYFTNNILFINPKGDTLELSEGENFSAIAIGADTFRYYKKQFLLQLTHNTVYNLLLKRSLKFNGTEKKGAYDTYSSTAASTSYNNIQVQGVGIVKLTPDENSLYTFTDEYFFAGRFGQFYPATKKGIHDLFSKNEKQLKEFLDENKINLTKKEDLDKVLEFALKTLK
jgi:hypothetical protein